MNTITENERINASVIKDYILTTDLPSNISNDAFVNYITGKRGHGNTLEDYLIDNAFYVSALEQDINRINDFKITKLEETISDQKKLIEDLREDLEYLKYTVEVNELYKDYKVNNTTPNTKPKKIAWMKRPISQYSLKGVFIKNWDSAEQARDITGKFNAHAIVHHIQNGSTGKSGGYVWKEGHYTEEV
tara:strand:- start:2909 stop:3475 length:567 start_codon:yes stop_codon:yes gene_type:complete